jgi:hypothetical protein
MTEIAHLDLNSPLYSPRKVSLDRLLTLLLAYAKFKMHPDILSELDVARLEKLIIRFENEATF